MTTRRITASVLLGGIGVAVGCDGESSSSPAPRNVTAGHAALAGAAGRLTSGGGSGQAGAGGELGGSGRASQSGGTGGPASSGGSSGLSSGDAGQGGVTSCTPIEDGQGEGGDGSCAKRRVDTCCSQGTPWGLGHDYFTSDVAACGEERTCVAVVCTPNGCQDTYNPLRVDLRCCADGRWHLIEGDYQLLDFELEAAPRSPLSPACGGEAIPSTHALHFDGSSYLELPLLGPADEFSLEIWFRTTEATGPLLSSTSSVDTLYLSAGRVCFYSMPGSEPLCTSEAGFSDGEWHHAAVARAGDRIVKAGVYVDGRLRAPGLFGGSSVTGLRAGYGPIGSSASPAYFSGDLDEIRVWSGERNPFQILDYYSTRFDRPEIRGQLLGYWPLEEEGMSETTANLKLPRAPERPPPDPCDPHGGGGGGQGGEGGAPDAFVAPAGTLVGFTFASSPWLEPGAF